MHNRLIRSSILAVVIVVGLAAGFLLWDSQQQSIASSGRSRALNERLDALLADLMELGTAQQAYIAPGQADGPWMGRVSALLQRLYDETAAIGTSTRAVGAPSLLAMRESLDSLIAIDGQVREYLRVGQDLMASDLVFNDARASLASLAATVRALRNTDAVQSADAARSRTTLQASVLGGAVAIWLAGTLMLVRVPRAASAAGIAAAEPLPAIVDAESAAGRANALAAPAVPSIDWTRAAHVCSELARLNDATRIPALFGDVAEALDGSGVILWLGAGEQLFAASAHGYAPRLLARLGPIGRDADNATAAAWRDGQLRVVAGDPATNGAIVAPLTGPDGCRGVLAVELRQGRESDPAAQAVAMMVAAQLAGLVASWPAASAPVAQAM